MKRAWSTITHHPISSGLIVALLSAASIGAWGQLVSGDDERGGVDPATTAEPTTGSAESPEGRTWRERAGTGGARTFADPHTLSQTGERIRPNQVVQVSCKVYAPEPASVVPDGYWYRVVSDPWNGDYYAPANSFWNGDMPGRRPYTHNTDFRIPDC